jgi:four helix bundle protein
MTNDLLMENSTVMADVGDNSGHTGEPSPAKRAFDLEERTARFGEAVIAFCKAVPKNVITFPLIGQLVKSGTSVGANYCEADDAVSKKEFRLKIGTCKKEARESKYWLRMIASAEDSVRDAARPLWVEAKELHLIFAKIYRS